MITGRERNPTPGDGNAPIRRSNPDMARHTVIHTDEIDLTVRRPRSNSSGCNVERVDNAPGLWTTG
ncbi:hypothetical protein GCM10009559_30290 [Pseudonocardia zijingensis]|jgi:hypothetical protein|uniref:Uncharacterized protein n=1 Tax=Pseudonocardia zijingensis TaxID=153376 RepID=A0ABP4AIU5_9PSEU